MLFRAFTRMVNFLVFKIFVIYLLIQHGNNAVLQRKDTINFMSMIAVKTGRNPLDYLNYGRYCGISGHGHALDSTDRCCEAHDACYTNLTLMEDCPNFISIFYFFLSYKWEKTEDSELNCVLEDGGRYSHCAFELCQCDVNIANCLSKATYNSHYHKTQLWRMFEDIFTTHVEGVFNFFFPKT